MLQPKTKACKHGTFSYFAEDAYVGRSLDLYGEYGEQELHHLLMMVRPGDVVVEVGANIGAHTIPLAKAVGHNGKVIAFEAHPVNAELLRRNVHDNGLTGIVEVHAIGLSHRRSRRSMPTFEELGHNNFGAIELGSGGNLEIKCVPLDQLLQLDKLHLLKIDVEGHEENVLVGAANTIERCHPIIYCENDRQNRSISLISCLVDMGYRLYWHWPQLYHPNNFFSHAENVFGNTVSINMLCVHEDSGIEVNGLDDVSDLKRSIDPDMYDREIRRYRRLQQCWPDDKHIRLILAHYANLMQRQDEADALVAQNLAEDPDHIESRLVQGLHHLQRGNWVEGWEGYEYRYQQKVTAPFGNRPHEGKRWDGRPTEEPLLIWCEQGFGDSIMFGRFVGKVYDLAPRAFLEVPPQLFELFELAGFEFPMPKVRMGRTLPPYTRHISIPSLPYVLGCNTDDDLRALPYLRADRAMVERWRSRNKARIGLCMRGSPGSERPFTRDIDPEVMAPLNKYGPFISLENHGQFESFADTAALISSLDLVITVDTSIAHLAGAIGVPTWLLLSFDPDWRWGLHGDRTIWYDSVRIFRQPKLMDWASVVAEVEEALAVRQERIAA